MPPLDTDTLAALIAKKHELLVQLRDLGRRQMELIDLGDMTQLLKLLASKQRLLAGMHATERQLDPFRHQDPNTRPWPTAAARDRCAAMADECDKLMAEVMSREKQSESQLRYRRDEAAARLQGVHAAAQARQAYAEAPAIPVSHLDLLSES